MSLGSLRNSLATIKRHIKQNHYLGHRSVGFGFSVTWLVPGLV
jgi:hypothetical protein